MQRGATLSLNGFFFRLQFIYSLLSQFISYYEILQSSAGRVLVVFRVKSCRVSRGRAGAAAPRGHGRPPQNNKFRVRVHRNPSLRAKLLFVVIERVHSSLHLTCKSQSNFWRIQRGNSTYVPPRVLLQQCSADGNFIQRVHGASRAWYAVISTKNMLKLFTLDTYRNTFSNYTTIRLINRFFPKATK